MRSVDADRGVRLDLPRDPWAIEALIAANRARLAELKAQPVGGVNSLGDLAVSDGGRWVLAELAAKTAGTMTVAVLIRAGVLPVAFLNVCACMVMSVALLAITLGLAVGSAGVQLARAIATRGLGRRVCADDGRRVRARARRGPVLTLRAVPEEAVPALRALERAHVRRHRALRGRARHPLGPLLDDDLKALAIDARGQPAVLAGRGMAGSGECKAERGRGEQGADDHGYRRYGRARAPTIGRRP